MTCRIPRETAALHLDNAQVQCQVSVKSRKGAKSYSSGIKRPKRY